MDVEEFREFGKAAIDFIADYTENLRDRNVLPEVEPGYLSKLLPNEAPEKPDNWQTVFEDLEKVILPGVSVFLKIIYAKTSNKLNNKIIIFH